MIYLFWNTFQRNKEELKIILHDLSLFQCHAANDIDTLIKLAQNKPDNLRMLLNREIFKIKLSLNVSSGRDDIEQDIIRL